MATDIERQALELKRKIDALTNQRDGYASPKDVMRREQNSKDKSKYNAAKKQFDDLTAQIKPLQTQLDSLNSQIKTKETADKKVKDDKAKQEKLNALEKEKQFAIDTKDEAKQKSIEEQINALKGTQTSSQTSGPQVIPGDDFGNALRDKGLQVVTDANGKSYVSSSKQGYEYNNSQHFFYLGSGGTIDISPSYSEVEKKVLQDVAKQPGGVDGFLKKLYTAGLIKKSTYENRLLESDDFTSGLQYALSEYSKKTIRDYEVGGTKEPITFDAYLGSNLKAPGPQVSYDAKITTRDTAASDLDRFFITYVGRGATKEEHDEYYKQLRAAEKKAVVTTSTKNTESGGTSQTQSGEYLDAIDILEMQRKVAGKALANTDLDTVLKSGAEAAQSVNSVLSYAKDYGIVLSPKDAMKYVADGLKAGQADDKAIKAKLLAISKSTYSNLADSLSENVSLRELSSNYIYQMRDTLELNQDSIDLMDPLLQTAFKNNGNKGVMNLTEFDKLMRNDKRWATTKNAREEAANYAYSILKDFGLMA